MTPVMSSPGRNGEPDPERLVAFRERGRQLAEQVQEELGPEWEIRVNDGAAWAWVKPPSSWEQPLPLGHTRRLKPTPRG
jgi:hypothetical protein